MQDDNVRLYRKKMTIKTCIPLRYLCGDLFLHLLSHDNRAKAATSAAATSLQSPEDERRREHHKELTLREETMTSPSLHLGLQCSYSNGALQHHNHYDRCTSCDPRRRHQRGAKHPGHLPSPLRRRHQGWKVLHAQPTTTTTTYSLQSSTALHLHSQSGPVNFGHTSTSVSLSTSTSWTSPTMRRNLLQQTSWCEDTSRTSTTWRDLHDLRQALQEPQDERATASGWSEHVEMTTLIDSEIRQVTRDLIAQRALQDATTTAAHRAGELLVTSSCILQSPTANQTTIYFVDFKEQTSVGRCFDNWDINMWQPNSARVQQYTLYRALVHPQPRWTETSQQQQFQIWIQDVSALRNDTSCHRRCLEGQYSNQQLAWTYTATSSTTGATTSYLARSTTDDR